MTSSPAKRRKTGHGDGGLLDDAISAAVRQPTTFVLETAELLKESRFDYQKSLEGVDELLRRLKTSIEAIESHEPIPVGSVCGMTMTLNTLVLTCLDRRRREEAQESTPSNRTLSRTRTTQGLQL